MLKRTRPVKTLILGSSIMLLAACGNDEPQVAPAEETATPETASQQDDAAHHDHHNTSTTQEAAAAETSAEHDGWYAAYYDERFPNKKEWFPLNELKANPTFGIYELTQFPDMEPTAEQSAAADELVKATMDAALAQGLFDKATGLNAGYAPLFDDDIHYGKEDLLNDEHVLNPEKTEFMMYYDMGDEPLLVGAMFTIHNGHGPQVGGPLTLWHMHEGHVICYNEEGLPEHYAHHGDNHNNHCASGDMRSQSPEMIHVWFFDHPDGRFASRMTLTEEEMQQAKVEIDQYLQATAQAAESQ